MLNKNLIVGTALGYNWKDIKNFVKSLRNVFDGDIILLMNLFSNQNLKKKLKFYRINTIHCSLIKKIINLDIIIFIIFLKKYYKL